MAEQTLVLVQAVANVLVLCLLITAWNAACVALGRLHALSALVERSLFVSFLLVALLCAALRLLTVRRHRDPPVIDACLSLSPWRGMDRTRGAPGPSRHSTQWPLLVTWKQATSYCE